MKWSIFRAVPSFPAILIAVLTIQAALSLAEHTKKKVIIRVPTRVQHIYHHHTKKIHIHKAKHVKHKPDVHVIVEEDVHPTYPKWKPRPKQPRGLGLHESIDWDDEGYESNWRPQHIRHPIKWKGESDVVADDGDDGGDEEEDYYGGQQASDNYNSYNDDSYRMTGAGGKKRRPNNYKEDAYFGQSNVRVNRERYKRRPRHPTEHDYSKMRQGGNRNSKYREGPSTKRMRYKEPHRPDVGQIFTMEKLPERKVNPHPVRSTQWSKPVSIPDEYMDDDDAVPYSRGHHKAEGNHGYSSLKVPEIEKGFEPSAYSPLTEQLNSVTHSQIQDSSLNWPAHYLNSIPNTEKPADEFLYQTAQQHHSTHQTTRYPHHVWTPSPDQQPLKAASVQQSPPYSGIYLTRPTTPPPQSLKTAPAGPGYRNEISTDPKKGNTVAYQSHVGHNYDASHPASSFQSVVFGQRIKPAVR